MKHLKTFEQYDLGRFNDEDVENAVPEREFDDEFVDFEDEHDELENDEDTDDEQGQSEDDELTYQHERDKCTCPECTCGEESEGREKEPKNWGDGDEIVEKKKMNAGFAAYLAKKKAGKKGDDKKDDKKEDKKDPKCKKCDDKKEKGGKGLSAAQKKLPPALQKAILAKKK